MKQAFTRITPLIVFSGLILLGVVPNLQARN